MAPATAPTRHRLPLPATTLVDVLSDHGFLLRTLHLALAVLWLGLAWWFELAWRPVIRRDDTVPAALVERSLLWYRWGAAGAWATGLLYASFLGTQHPDGLVAWMHGPLRGQWIALGFCYASLMVFLVWFVITPRQRLLLDPGRGDAATRRAWRRTETVASRTVAWLATPLLYAMGAGRHAGELAALSDGLPTDFAAAAGIVTAGGLSASALLHGLAAWLAGRGRG